MSMNVSAEMDSIGTALSTISGLRVHDFVPKSAQPPFAFVDYPETVDYDTTKQRGKDTAVFPIFVAVGNMSDRSARDELAAYLNGTGTKSIKAAVDLAGSRRVTSADVAVMTVSGIDFLAARFDVEVVA